MADILQYTSATTKFQRIEFQNIFSLLVESVVSSVTLARKGNYYLHEITFQDINFSENNFRMDLLLWMQILPFLARINFRGW